MKGNLGLSSPAAIGRRIRAKREQRELSQRELTNGATFTYAYLSRIESGDRVASLAVLIELADRLGVPAIELAYGADELPHHCPLCGRLTLQRDG